MSCNLVLSYHAKYGKGEKKVCKFKVNSMTASSDEVFDNLEMSKISYLVYY